MPFRDCRNCITHLVSGNCGITVYRRVRSPTGTGNLIGHSVVHIIAPNAIVRDDVLRSSGGGCVTDVFLENNTTNLYFTSISANATRVARLGQRGVTPTIVTRLYHCRPDRILVGPNLLSYQRVATCVGGGVSYTIRLIRRRQCTPNLITVSLRGRFNHS